MAATNLEGLFEIGIDVISTTLMDDGTLISVTGDVLNPKKAPVDDTTELWGLFGFASRPTKAVQGQNAAQMITIKQADRDIGIAYRDLRAQPIYGNLGEGESMMFATGANGFASGRIACKADGSVNLYTTDTGTLDGIGSLFQHSPSGLRYQSKYGSMIFDETGFHIITSSGGRLDVGGMAGGIPSMTSMARLSASLITLDGPTVSLGPSAANGGLGSFPIMYGFVPGPKFTPVLGAGIGAVTTFASASTCVLVSP